MVVQHNLRAMNSNRMLGLTQSQQAKSSEKLSSGYKINRAADDAAGLSISEKMRKQIRGLTQASLNAQDGISAVQTAEGALHEVQDMLQRMNELAVKAANGTMSEDDRGYIQDEIDQLITEIDRVSETTKFNESYLLKGDGEEPLNAEKTFRDLGTDKPVTAKLTGADGTRQTVTAKTDENGITELNLGDLKNIKAGDTITIDGQTYTFANAATDTNYTDNTINVLIGTVAAGGGAQVPTPIADVVAAIEKEVQGKSDSLYTANPNTGNVEKAAIYKDDDGNYILRMQSRADATRVKTNGAQDFKTSDGVVITTTNGQVVEDGQEIVVGSVELVGNMTDKTGAAATAKNTYTINLDKYEGEEMSLVYDNADSLWTATTPSGDTRTYSTDELYDLGIGVQKADDKTTFAKLNDGTNGFTLAEGFTLKITKGIVADTSDSLVTSVNLNGVDLSKYDLGEEIKVTAKVTGAGLVGFNDVDPTKDGIKPLHFSLQVGADTTAENKITVDIESMSAKSLGISKVRVDGTDSKNADAAVGVIAEAIQKVSTQRSALGAVQNRLEHTINNLDNVVENTTAAESQIRDTDMATEMVKFSNNNILAQAGQAMLAQSNQANQGVLALLQ